MEWWNDLWTGIGDWAASTQGWRIISGAIIPAVAILVAAIVAGLIARGAVRTLFRHHERQERTNAVAALITAGEHAAKWGSQSPAARERAEELGTAATIAVRLLPMKGADRAADWAEARLESLRSSSVNVSLSPDIALAEFTETLAEWLHHPKRAKQLFIEPSTFAGRIAASGDYDASSGEREEATAALPAT